MKELFKNLKFAWKYSKEDKVYLIIVLTFHLINIFLSIIAPILSAKIIIELTNNNYIQIIIVALTIFLAALIIFALSAITIGFCPTAKYINIVSLDILLFKLLAFSGLPTKITTLDVYTLSLKNSSRLPSNKNIL